MTPWLGPETSPKRIPCLGNPSSWSTRRKASSPTSRPPPPRPIALSIPRATRPRITLIIQGVSPPCSLPQQATPLTSQQGVANPEDLADPVKAHARVAQDGQAEDDPMNPSGTPDYMIAPEDFQGPEAVDRREERRREEHREGVHGNQS